MPNALEFEISDSLVVELTPAELSAAAALMNRLLAVTSAQADLAAYNLSVLARGIYESRRDRRHFFPDDLFADPAWDMLLILYAGDAAGEELTVTSLCVSAGVPQSTALRWTRALEEAGLIARKRHPADGRSSVVSLTQHAHEMMTGYLQRILLRHLQSHSGRA